MQIGKIEFGEIDAKNEVLKQKRVGKGVFKNSFQAPPRIDVDSLLSGENYLITGKKGCGKTALLLYVQELGLDRGWATETIFFRSGISEPERQDFLSGTPYEVIEVDGKTRIDYDFIFNWMWLIYSNILRRIEPEHLISGQDVLKDLKSLLGVGSETKVRPFTDLTANKIIARAQIGLDAKFVKGDIGAEVQLAKEERRDRLPMHIIQICEKHFDQILLRPKNRVSIAFDELELFFSRSEQRDRDLRLIRDLLQAVSRVNRTFAEAGSAVSVLASVRTEVLSEVNQIAPEMWRDLADFSVEVNWNVKASAAEQPILDIVEAKIRASEIESSESPSSEVWDQYFPFKIYGREIESYLLDISMFKPRLIVLRLSLAKKYNPDDDFFTADHFEETNTSFSYESWREVQEQLSQSFTQKQLQNLRRILTAWKSSFTINELEERANDLNYHEPGTIDGFRSRTDVKAVLQALYETGAVGNRFLINDSQRYEARDRWAFRGYDEPAFDQRFQIHESLRKFFQVMHD